MDVRSKIYSKNSLEMKIDDHSGDILVNANKKSRRKRPKDAAIKMSELRIDDHPESLKRFGESKVTNFDLENNDFETVSIVQPLEEQTKMDRLLSDNVSKGDENGKKKTTKKMKKSREEFRSIDDKMDIESVENITVANEKAIGKHKDEGLTIDQENSMSAMTSNLSEMNVNGRRKGKRKTTSIMVEKKDESLITNHTNSLSNFELSCRNYGEEAAGKVCENEDVPNVKMKEMNTEFADTQAEGNSTGKKNRKKNKTKAVQENMCTEPSVAGGLVYENKDIQSKNENRMDKESADTQPEGNSSGKKKRKKKSKSTAMQENMCVEPTIIGGQVSANEDIQSMKENKIDSGSASTQVEANLSSKTKRRKENKSKVVQENLCAEPSFIAGQVSENEDIQSMKENKIDTGSADNQAEGNSSAKNKRNRKNKSKAMQENMCVEPTIIGGTVSENEDIQSMKENKIDTVSADTQAEANLSSKRKKMKENKSKAVQENMCVEASIVVGQVYQNEDVQSMNVNKMDKESADNHAEGNLSAKKKRKKKNKSKAMQENMCVEPTIVGGQVSENQDIQSMKENKMDIGSANTQAEANSSSKKKRRKENKSKVVQENMCVEPSIIGGQVSEDVNIRSMKENKMDIVPADTQAEANSSSKKKRRKENQSKSVQENICVAPSIIGGQVSENEVQSENNLKPKTADAQVGVNSNVKKERRKKNRCKDISESMSISPTISHRRKLLVLDVNGLLSDIVMPPPKDHAADTRILGRAIFKRPFCDDFLKFCFQNFDVGIWSSRTERVIVRIVDYLLGNLKERLLFCWDMSHSTETGFKTLENCHKPLVCKELRKIWENDVPNFCWKKGDYNESNTLLLDDSPYKALLNPAHTAIFPHSYHYDDNEDNSLGPGGDLRVYLEGILESSNTREYVEQHPFGQSGIDETHISWPFYSQILQSMNRRKRCSPFSKLASFLNLKEHSLFERKMC